MNRRCARTVLAMGALLLAGACGGGGGDGATVIVDTSLQAWIHADANPGDDYALGMDSFPDSSTVVCGWFSGTHTFALGKAEQTERTALGQHDGYVCRYDPEGRLLWVQTIIGFDFVAVDEVVALPDGACIVMGTAREFAILGAGTPTQVATPAGASTFVAKYLADGALDWAKVIPGSEADIRGGCLVPDGSVAFCGRISATAPFANGEPEQTDLDAMSTSSLTDFVARYAADGTLIYAVAPTDSSGATYATGVTALPDNSVVVVGIFQDPIVIAAGTPQEEMFTQAGFDDGYAIRLSATGSVLWGRHMTGSARLLPSELTTMPDGTVVVLGTGTAADLTFNTGENDALSVNGSTEGNTFLVAYTSAGSPIWAKLLSYGTGAFLNLAGIAAYDDSTFVIIGYGPGEVTLDPGGPNQTLSDASTIQLLIARYDSAGALQWARRDGGDAGSLSRGEGVAAYPDGAIGFAGGFQTSFTVDDGGPGETTYPGLQLTDTVVVRYNADGTHDGS